MEIFYFDFSEKIMVFWTFWTLFAQFWKVPKRTEKTGSGRVKGPRKKYPAREIVIRGPFCNHGPMLINKRIQVPSDLACVIFYARGGQFWCVFWSFFQNYAKKGPNPVFKEIRAKKHDFFQQNRKKKFPWPWPTNFIAFFESRNRQRSKTEIIFEKAARSKKLWPATPLPTPPLSRPPAP